LTLGEVGSSGCDDILSLVMTVRVIQRAGK
jgi:hypothetical protein